MQPSDPTTRQWTAVAIFYTAMHLIEVYFDQFGIEHRSHQERRRDMLDPRFGIPRPIDTMYRQLYWHSYGARYLFVQPSEQVVQRLLMRNLAGIAGFVGVTI